MAPQVRRPPASQKSRSKAPREVDGDDIPPLTSDDATTVTAEEDEMLMGDPTSVTGEMAQLQVTSPDSHKPEDSKTS